MKKCLLLLLFSGGCHTCQLLRLQQQLGVKNYDWEYVICRGYRALEDQIRTGGHRFYITEPRGKADNKATAAAKTVRCFADSIRILRRSRADAVITTGPGVAAIFAFVAKKIMRKKIRVLYIEDQCRIYNKSKTGKLMERFNLADMFFVQWPSMENKYKDAIFAGRLM